MTFNGPFQLKPVYDFINYSMFCWPFVKCHTAPPCLTVLWKVLSTFSRCLAPKSLGCTQRSNMPGAESKPSWPWELPAGNGPSPVFLSCLHGCLIYQGRHSLCCADKSRLEARVSSARVFPMLAAQSLAEIFLLRMLTLDQGLCCQAG